MNLADSPIDCLRGCLATLNVLVVRIALLEYSYVAFKMYYVMRASAPSLHRESVSTDSLIMGGD